MSVQIKKIDDRDPSVHRSSGDWSDGGNGLEYMGTTSRTNRLGASLTIPFTGTKIVIFGTVDWTGAGQTPTSLFSVDQGRATQYTGTQLSNDQNYGQKFYESDTLPYGNHVLVVTISNAPSITASFTFDWAEIYDPGPPTPPSTSHTPTPSTSSTVSRSPPPPTTSNTPPTQSSGTSSTASSSSTSRTITSSESNSSSASLPNSSYASSSLTSTALLPTGSANNNTSLDAQHGDQQDQASTATSSKSPIAPIIGGVVGALALIIIMLLGIIFCLRRKRRAEGGKLMLPTHAGMSPLSTAAAGTDITPFLTSPRTSGQFTARGSDSAFGLSSPSNTSDYQMSGANIGSHAKRLDGSYSATSPSASSNDGRSMMFTPAGAPESYGVLTKQEQAQQDRNQRRISEAPPPGYDDPF
ncbi:hypothetical protein CPC08DRAFT_815629 [Agrocybe pediades]|nr:hypothetical protein CPC08DRAFT_815629 [Agrocybe pediades]